MKADAQTEAAVMAVFGKVMEAWGARDIDAAMACFAPDRDSVHIGSEADERMVGPAELRELLERALQQLDAGSWELGWHSVSAAGPVAWLTADLDGHVESQGQETHVTRRLTMVLERRGDEWLIVHSHGSVPEGEAWPGEPSSGGSQRDE